VPQDRLLRYIDEARDFPSLRLVVFSGGEAFLLGKDLVQAVRRCTDNGFLTRIVSNGYWAVNETGAHARIRPLVEAGLGELNFSTGDDHAKFVPLDRIITGLDVAMSYGLGLSLMIEQRATRGISKESIIREAERFPDVAKALSSGAINVVESPWMEFTDHQGDEINWLPGTLVNADNIHARKPCTSVLANITVTPDDRLGMCCGLPREDIADLTVGDLREESLSTVFRRHMHDFLKIWLFVEGPEKMLAWAAGWDSSIEWENKYAHNCDVCRVLYSDPRFMSVLTQHGAEKMNDVMALFALYSAGPDLHQLRSEENARHLSHPLPDCVVNDSSGSDDLIQISTA